MDFAIEKTLKNSSNTFELGAKLAEALKNDPALVLLSGELGAGKTTFAQGFLQYFLGKNAEILSPTYSYLNTYMAKNLQLFHFDLYRIENEEEIFELGLEDFLFNNEAMRLVEWPQRAPYLEGMAQVKIHLFTKASARSAQIFSKNVLKLA